MQGIFLGSSYSEAVIPKLRGKVTDFQAKASSQIATNPKKDSIHALHTANQSHHKSCFLPTQHTQNKV